MDEYDMQELYSWIDVIPLSRPKRNITRDFSDGVMVAEVVKHFIPRIVDLHNYQPANSTKQKTENWKTLNMKVFKKLDFVVPPNVIQGVVAQKPGVIEVVLNNLRLKLQQYLAPPRATTEVTRLDHHGSPTHERHQHQHHVGMDVGDPHGDVDYGAHEPRLPSISNPRKGAKPGRRAGGVVRNGPSGKGRMLGNARPPPPPQGRELMGGGVMYGRDGGAMLGRGQQSPHMHYPQQDDMDPYDIIEQQKAEILDCQEVIDMMQVKIEKLTKLVQLKDKRIQDLTRTVRGNPHR